MIQCLTTDISVLSLNHPYLSTGVEKPWHFSDEFFPLQWKELVTRVERYG
ncbi:hypothetical protein [uncultured Bacteroides sp.]|nr:hypothetical protein [uncultured Bacteroides sp.]